MIALRDFRIVDFAHGSLPCSFEQVPPPPVHPRRRRNVLLHSGHAAIHGLGPTTFAAGFGGFRGIISEIAATATGRLVVVVFHAARTLLTAP